MAPLLFSGVGILVSGILIAMGRLAGAWCFAAVFAAMFIWSALETAGDVAELLPRMLVPGLLCAYLLSAKVRSRLS